MSAMPAVERMTAEGFLALPEQELRRAELQPDLVSYRAARSPRRDDRPQYPVADLAVQLRSPSTWRYDIAAKKAGYERRGPPERWLVDIAADEVLVFRRSAPEAAQLDVALELTREDTLTSPPLPGLRSRSTPSSGSSRHVAP